MTVVNLVERKHVLRHQEKSCHHKSNSQTDRVKKSCDALSFHLRSDKGPPRCPNRVPFLVLPPKITHKIARVCLYLPLSFISISELTNIGVCARGVDCSLGPSQWFYTFNNDSVTMIRVLADDSCSNRRSRCRLL